MTDCYKVIVLTADRDLSGDEYAALLSLVSPDKRALLQRKKEKDRRPAQNSLLADVLVRRELCHLTGLQNKDLRFGSNEHHKPFLMDWPEIHYNLSHSGTIVVAAFDRKPIGIDVEFIKPINNLVTRRVFGPEEREHYARLPQEERLHYFYTIWTMKEAYLKKEGVGLTRPMHLFDVISLPNERFFPVPLGEQAICYMCTAQNTAPVYVRETT
ncbi:MAG: 4'-phosphopantetheinyl transferase superfamily protein [Treponema sp.]|jgi:4'-phosphopantetheinyl transferase|nr:4'-phosphopantetheinyl transferase superfamily protein [Treponema sp.]